MSETKLLVTGATAIAIDGRALVLEGPPGVGKSSLALALIDRGAELIGDDGVTLDRLNSTVYASPPPNTQGLIEIRNVGIVGLPTIERVPLALILTLIDAAERLPHEPESRDILSNSIPVLPFTPGTIAPAVRAEWALKEHGLSFD